MPIDPALVDPAHTAIVMNECQRGVVGDLATLGQLKELAAEPMANLGRLVRAGRPKGVQVIHCVAKGRADGKGGNTNTRMAGVARRARQQPGYVPPDPDTFAEIVPEIGVEPEDFYLTRIHGMGCMSDTGLDPLLRNLGISTLVVGGVSVNVGVTNLVFDAMNRSYDIVCPRDASAGVPYEYAQAVMDNSISMCARLTTTDELVDIWSKHY
jgi:nicotinamidase-related amidase